MQHIVGISQRPLQHPKPSSSHSSPPQMEPNASPRGKAFSVSPAPLTLRELKQLQVPAPGTDALARAHSLSNKDRPHSPPTWQRDKYQPRLVCFFSSSVLVTGEIYLFPTKGAWLCSSSPSSPAGPQHSTCPPKAPRGSSPHRCARQNNVPSGLGVDRTQKAQGISPVPSTLARPWHAAQFDSYEGHSSPGPSCRHQPFADLSTHRAVSIRLSQPHASAWCCQNPAAPAPLPAAATELGVEPHNQGATAMPKPGTSAGPRLCWE